MKNFIKEKRNALAILATSALGCINYFPKEYRFIRPYVNDIAFSFIVFTSIIYFVIALALLLFFNNYAVKKWFVFSLPFIFMTVPIYIYIGSQKLDIFNGILFIPVFLIYFVLFAVTPFYLHRKQKQ